MDTKAELGRAVIYTDPRGVDHDAVVTAVWGPACINVVFVSTDESKGDQYGRQIERETSVTHCSSLGAAWGRCYRLVGQPKPEIAPPVAK